LHKQCRISIDHIPVGELHRLSEKAPERRV
jgi:hypothetical protein